ncbi:hypothetical protein ANCDUO_02882 [Ancylostoma duodenale]|uniref:Uncharacterized protein n=1 Tax=Ancylostoma duodenale TaxID=51022 RepID=A0A0C2H5H4_9BILA|nr:hypothetical protein ANCDUO_02882 [Ancylostoma duodenale]
MLHEQHTDDRVALISWKPTPGHWRRHEAVALPGRTHLPASQHHHHRPQPPHYHHPNPPSTIHSSPPRIVE